MRMLFMEDDETTGDAVDRAVRAVPAGGKLGVGVVQPRIARRTGGRLGSENGTGELPVQYCQSLRQHGG